MVDFFQCCIAAIVRWKVRMKSHAVFHFKSSVLCNKCEGGRRNGMLMGWIHVEITCSNDVVFRVGRFQNKHAICLQSPESLLDQVNKVSRRYMFDEMKAGDQVNGRAFLAY